MCRSCDQGHEPTCLKHCTIHSPDALPHPSTKEVARQTTHKNQSRDREKADEGRALGDYVNESNTISIYVQPGLDRNVVQRAVTHGGRVWHLQGWETCATSNASRRLSGWAFNELDVISFRSGAWEQIKVKTRCQQITSDNNQLAESGGHARWRRYPARWV